MNTVKKTKSSRISVDEKKKRLSRLLIEMGSYIVPNQLKPFLFSDLIKKHHVTWNIGIQSMRSILIEKGYLEDLGQNKYRFNKNVYNGKFTVAKLTNDLYNWAEVYTQKHREQVSKQKVENNKVVRFENDLERFALRTTLQNYVAGKREELTLIFAKNFLKRL